MVQLLLSGCINQESARAALSNPMILELVKGVANPLFIPTNMNENKSYNACSSISRSYYCAASMATDCSRPIQCDELDEMLSNQGYSFDGSSLVTYYITNSTSLGKLYTHSKLIHKTVSTLVQ